MLRTQKINLFEYVSDVGDLHGDYDRRDYLNHPKHLSSY